MNMKQSEKLLKWAMEAETTARCLREAGQTTIAARFESDVEFFLNDAVELEKKGE